MIRSELSHLPRAKIAKVCYENACALYGHPLPLTEWLERATMGV